MTLREQHELERRFRAWVAINRAALVASGIPLAAWASARSWDYFVEHEDLPYELDASRFSACDLAPSQSRVLLEILESKYGDTAYAPSLLARLRREVVAEAAPTAIPPSWATTVGEAPRLEEELRREVGPGHVLWNREVRAAARRRHHDDVLVVAAAEPPTIAVVHLTWSGVQESDPRLPETMLFPSFEDWRKYAMNHDAEDDDGKNE